jgi:ubiquinone/menaquinone biosynthesis C-methylase UbiE
MDKRVVSLLCDPATHESLELREEASAGGAAQPVLVNPKSGQRFPIREGIPVFLNEGEVSGLNRKYQKMYDWMAPGYDLVAKLYAFFKRTDLRGMRWGYLEELEIKGGDQVLEVSVGTGTNIPLLPPNIEFYGLDISWGMLKKCRQNLKGWKREANLFYGKAESLPFKSESFDVVFHFGGINFFNDKARAIQEMIRVAKPGTKIVISDETEKHVKRAYEKAPLLGRYFQGREEEVSPPNELVPPEMLEVRLKEFRDGRLYCLSFRKPGQPLAPQVQRATA